MSAWYSGAIATLLGVDNKFLQTLKIATIFPWKKLDLFESLKDSKRCEKNLLRFSYWIHRKYNIFMVFFGYFTFVPCFTEWYPDFKELVCLYLHGHEVRLHSVSKSWRNANMPPIWFVYTQYRNTLTLRAEQAAK